MEGHTLTFPQVLPHTHTILSGLGPVSLDQGWLRGGGGVAATSQAAFSMHVEQLSSSTQQFSTIEYSLD